MADGHPVESTFAATGVSTAKAFEKGALTIAVASGDTFNATIELQKRVGDEWIVISTYTEAVTDKNIDHGSKVMTRLECTAYTSGPIIYSFG